MQITPVNNYQQNRTQNLKQTPHFKAIKVILEKASDGDFLIEKLNVPDIADLGLSKKGSLVLIIKTVFKSQNEKYLAEQASTMINGIGIISDKAAYKDINRGIRLNKNIELSTKIVDSLTECSYKRNAELDKLLEFFTNLDNSNLPNDVKSILVEQQMKSLNELKNEMASNFILFQKIQKSRKYRQKFIDSLNK